MKRIVSLVLALALALCSTVVVALAKPSPKSDFKFNYRTGVITGYRGQGGEVVIPKKIWGKTVLGIDQGAFSGCSNITSISIPDTVVYLGERAFFYCTGLEMVKFGENSQLNYIGQEAFKGCVHLVSIDLPKGLMHLPEEIFARCVNLTFVILPENLCSIGAGAFSDCMSLPTILLPANVSNIQAGAFRNCTSLQGLLLRDRSFILGRHAFDLCASRNKERHTRNPSLKVVVYPGSREEWEMLILGTENLTLEKNQDLEVICLG